MTAMKHGPHPMLLDRVSIFDLPNRCTLAVGREPRPDAAIRASFEGQDPAALLFQVPFRGAERAQVDLITIPQGQVVFSEGIDGVVFTAEGRLVKETALFAADYPPRLRMEMAAQDVDEDWVSIFDCSWTNHFHTLVLAYPKLVYALAWRPNAKVVIPARRQLGGASDQPAMIDQLLALSGYGSRVVMVEDGVYRPRNLHLVWANHGQQPAIHQVEDTFACFEPLARSISSDIRPAMPKRIFIERVRDSRLLDRRAIRSLDRHLAAHRFTKIRLETLNLEDQIQLFAGATHVVAAHGAGLSNIVFGRSDLRILELNLDLDGQGTLRPWFLLLAAGRGQHYQYLNASACELADLTLGLAFDRLMNTNRQAVRLGFRRLRGRLIKGAMRWLRPRRAC